MWATYIYSLRRLRWTILFGSGVMAFFAGINAFAFQYLQEDMREPLTQLLASLPLLLQVLAGDPQQFFTPEGFLRSKFFLNAAVLIGLIGAWLGSGLVAEDEEKGRLDLLAAYPVSRTRMFIARVLATASAMGAMVGMALLAVAICIQLFEFGIALGALAAACLSLWLLGLFFAGVGMLMSMALPTRLMAAVVSGGILLMAISLETFAPMIDAWAWLADYSPLAFYHPIESLTMNAWPSLAMLLCQSVLVISMACFLYRRRDLRVIGEGEWRWRTVGGVSLVWITCYLLLTVLGQVWQGQLATVAG